MAANWKMNLTHEEVGPYLDRFLTEAGELKEVEVVLIPAFTSIPALAATAATPVALGAQNLHWEKGGAFTGEVSAAMLRALKVKYVVIGHSERRQGFGETDEVVAKKVAAALNAGLHPVLCVGEILAERDAGRVEDVLGRQPRESLAGCSPEDLSRVVIAYEPVRAISTGRTATAAQAQETHAYIRSVLASAFGPPAAEGVRIQYGGSVKPDNARALLGQPDVDGALVGGASLDPRSLRKSSKAPAKRTATAPIPRNRPHGPKLTNHRN